MKKVLVIDDEPDLLEIVRSHLEDGGFTVLTASGGKEGLELAQRSKPNLIILDIAMPEMNGLEMLEILRKKPGFYLTPVIMLTAQGQTGNIFEAERLHAVDFLIKPFTREELLKAVGQFIE